MSGYFGTEVQQRLQARAEEAAAFIAATPGACQTGRTMGCDDPDRFGWAQIDEFLERDGVFGFRLLSAVKAREVGLRLEERGFRFDTWDVFLADRATALAACAVILSDGLPDGSSSMHSPHDPDGDDTRRIQTLIAETGVVPFSGSLLVGRCGPAKTFALQDREGRVVAAAHGYLPHNAHSPYRSYAWGGLVAVAAAQRGRGLGSCINALMIAGVMQDLQATHIYEIVSASNAASRRMVAACGLRHEPDLVSGIATPVSEERFTR